jgi:hypothetical protein
VNIALATCLLLLGTADPQVEIRLETWTATIEPDTLTIRAVPDGEQNDILVASGPVHRITDVQRTADAVGWKIPDLGLTVELERHGNHLRARFSPTGNATIEWPRTGSDPQLSALIVPEGEGLYIPLADAAWRRRLAGTCDAVSGGLSMPFWSYQVGTRTLTFHLLSDLRSTLCLQDREGRIAATLTHEFDARDGQLPYEIDIWFGGSSPIAPAQ